MRRSERKLSKKRTLMPGDRGLASPRDGEDKTSMIPRLAIGASTATLTRCLHLLAQLIDPRLAA
jgi:hypothetical protein